jgi:hypothetical protein
MDFSLTGLTKVGNLYVEVKKGLSSFNKSEF